MNKKTLKERIVETSLILFEEKGYHGVSVDQIVKEAGASKGGFYHNFKSKDELLYHIHDVFISYVIDKAQEAYDQYDTPISRLCAIIHSFTKVFDLYKFHITVFYQESTYLAGEFEAVINEKRDRYRRIILQVIEEGQQSGDFRDVSAEISTMAFIGMINWSYKWFNKEGKFTIEEIADIFIDLILHSLITEKGLEELTTEHLLLHKQPSI
ncbi:AcrR family transcriptional regulator [Oikeobacillus pervagus]|uniref:AcrR family transcriptional regulator n=1 Tax=Oikeobacillus pervagus TaxID=1325931 RepID=A0AAJ1T3R6_9BACI|nr:TetR/AcrR family transcriptional regulator [Oikeobacillus pervagus]MDQ0214686.1 AcrR family transcriptional regulator [Oikeobacillus pervagus]